MYVKSLPPGASAIMLEVVVCACRAAWVTICRTGALAAYAFLHGGSGE